MIELKKGDRIMVPKEPGTRFVVVKVIPEKIKEDRVIPAAVHCKEIVKFKEHHAMPWVNRFFYLDDVKLAPAEKKRRPA